MIRKLGAAALMILGSACGSGVSQQSVPTTQSQNTSTSVTLAPSTLPPTTTTASTATTATTEPPKPLPFGSFGMAVFEGRAATVQSIESRVGAKFDIVRWFARWDTPIPNADLAELARTKHAIHLSVRPRTRDGRNILWRDIADSKPGSRLYADLERLIDNAMAVGPNLYLTFNHEAETTDSSPNGDAEDFIDAWRLFYKILRERSGPLTDPSAPNEIAAVYTVGNSAFSDGRAEEFYPGDEFVDVVGVDVYNWYLCQGSERSWLQLDELLAPGVAFARAHGKPFAIPEFGSTEHPEDPSAKAEWMRNAAVTLNSPEFADELLFSAWFDVTGAGGAWPNCIWDHDYSPETFEGFRDLADRATKSG